MFGNGATVGADWVTGSAVGAQNRGVAVETGEVFGLAGVLLLGGTVKHVVGLVGGVHDITPEESSSDYRVLAGILLELYDNTY